MSAFSSDYLDCYYWKEHIEDIIKEAEQYVRNEVPIIDKTINCSLSDFLEKISIVVEEFMSFNAYARNICLYTNMLKDNELTQDEYTDCVAKLKVDCKEDYKQYLWLKNDFKIISHLYVMPSSTSSRKLPMLIVDKYFDGSYKIWGTLTVKFPKFDEILADLITDHYTEECERYVIVVDVEELFDKAEDIRDTNCGFRITKNCIEIFDNNDALKVFASIAQEALDSNNIEISKEFY